MKTRCPACATPYEIDAEALLEADGRACCLRCGTVFDAVSEQAEDAAGPADRPPPLRLDEQAMSIPEPEPEDDRPLPFTVPDNLPPLEPSADGALDVVDTLYEKPSYRRLVYATLATLLIGAFTLQLVWQYRAELLHRFPQLEVVCSYLPCRPEVVREPDNYRVLQREIAPTQNEPGSLTLNATIRNDAGIAQHLPDIQLSLIDNNGAVLIRRRLSPREYLYPPPSDDRVIQPGEVLTIEIDFEDPGHIASGFTIDFF